MIRTKCYSSVLTLNWFRSGSMWFKYNSTGSGRVILVKLWRFRGSKRDKKLFESSRIKCQSSGLTLDLLRTGGMWFRLNEIRKISGL